MDWNNIPNNNKDFEHLCQTSIPSDFYFAINNGMEFSDNLTMISIVPKLFFNQEDCELDRPMDIRHLLPSDFGELMENVWDSERTADEVRKDLISRGFEESIDFTLLVAANYD